MSDLKTLKLSLIKACMDQIESKIAILNSEFKAYQLSVSNETKSTAGDKHDTARSMMQMEQEKMGAQLKDLTHQKSILQSIENSQSDKTGGRIIRTDHGNFFISVYAKPVLIDNEEFIPVSAVSPIGKLLLISKPGSSFSINQKTYMVLST